MWLKVIDVIDIVIIRFKQFVTFVSIRTNYPEHLYRLWVTLRTIWKHQSPHLQPFSLTRFFLSLFSIHSFSRSVSLRVRYTSLSPSRVQNVVALSRIALDTREFVWQTGEAKTGVVMVSCCVGFLPYTFPPQTTSTRTATGTRVACCDPGTQKSKPCNNKCYRMQYLLQNHYNIYI